MKNYSNEEIKLVASNQDDQQIIAKLTVLTGKEDLNQNDMVIKTSLSAVLEERHGASELEHIEVMIQKKLAA
ncbi:MAG: hypothetical protein V7782_08880 [Psychromonas sp.]